MKEFAAYYDLFNKYKKDYMVYGLLDDNIADATVEKARKADIDERFSLLGMLLDIVLNDIKACMDMADYLSELLVMLKALRDKEDRYDFLETMNNNKKNLYDKRLKANSLDIKEKAKARRIIEFLNDSLKIISSRSAFDDESVFSAVKEKYEAEVLDMRRLSDKAKSRLHNLFDFTDRAFDKGNEMLVLVTELTTGKASSEFISMFGCEDYDKYNSKLMLSDRQNILKKQIENVVFETAL